MKQPSFTFFILFFLSDLKPLSSLPLQTFLYFDYLYSFIYFILEFFIFVYKGYGLFYPPQSLGPEVTMVVLFFFWQFGRIYIGSAGNRTETSLTIIFFLLLCIPTAFAFAFLIRLQTYVLMLELILNAVGIAFLIAEFIFAIIAFFAFKNFEKNQ